MVGGGCFMLKEIEIFFQRRALQLVLKKRSDAQGLKFNFILKWSVKVISRDLSSVDCHV